MRDKIVKSSEKWKSIYVLFIINDEVFVYIKKNKRWKMKKWFKVNKCKLYFYDVSDF